MRKALTISLLIIAISLFPMLLEAKSSDKGHGILKPIRLPHSVVAYIYPEELNTGDLLTDGPSGDPILIRDKTVLIWVDLDPGRRFAHPTVYVLIDDEGTRLLDGMWWPVLNQKGILYGNQVGYAVDSLFELPTIPEAINVYFFHHHISPEDSLRDGPQGVPFNIRENTFFIWVDLMPLADFAHPTQYILISPDGVRLEDGMWFPFLNDVGILLGRRPASVHSIVTLN